MTSETGRGVRSTGVPRFIVDHNVGKLVRWLRMMGYNTLFFEGADDADMVLRALSEERVILTRDTQIAQRRVAVSGRIKVILIESDRPEEQMRQVVAELRLDCQYRPFSLCLKCNRLLVERNPEQVVGRVPPYVFQTQKQYMECLACSRIYWRGTHWQAMTRELERFDLN